MNIDASGLDNIDCCASPCGAMIMISDRACDAIKNKGVVTLPVTLKDGFKLWRFRNRHHATMATSAL